MSSSAPQAFPGHRTVQVTRPELLRSTVVGIAAGLAASWIMNQFQAMLGALSEDKDSDSQGEEDKPTTVKTADMVTEAFTGEPVPKQMQNAADAAVHYGFGAFLGGLYGALGAVMPGVRSGFGTAYGAGAALVADETMIPALGLSPPPQETPVSTHASGMISHLVFGAALEGARRLIESALHSPTRAGPDLSEAQPIAPPAPVQQGLSA